METRANFLLVGVFVVLVLLGAARFVAFVATPVWRTGTTVYEFILAGPAGGLTPGDPIYFLGVKIGEILSVTVAKGERGETSILAKIENDAPIRANTRARIETTALMGVFQISLEGAAEPAPPLRARPGEEYPRLYIENTPNTLVDFADVAERFSSVTEKAEKTLGRLPSAWSGIKWNLDLAWDALKPPRREPGAGAAPSGSGLADLAGVTERLERLVAAAEGAQTARQIEKMKKFSADAQDMTADLPKLERLALELRQKVDLFDSKIRALGLTPASPLVVKGGR